MIRNCYAIQLNKNVPSVWHRLINFFLNKHFFLSYSTTINIRKLLQYKNKTKLFPFNAHNLYKITIESIKKQQLHNPETLFFYKKKPLFAEEKLSMAQHRYSRWVGKWEGQGGSRCSEVFSCTELTTQAATCLMKLQLCRQKRNWN